MKRCKTPTLTCDHSYALGRGCKKGFYPTLGEVCAPFCLKGGEHPRCLLYSLIVPLSGTVTSHQNVAVGCSVNVFKMKKGRLNPNS